MKRLLLSILTLGIAALAHAQAGDPEFPETPAEKAKSEFMNPNYYRLVESGGLSTVVRGLQEEVARFDAANAPQFASGDRTYGFVFRHPQGTIRTVFDAQGTLLLSQERYQGIIFPVAVRNAVYREYPGYQVTGSTYRVLYRKGKPTKKVFSLKIEKQGMFKRFKIDSDGVVL